MRVFWPIVVIVTFFAIITADIQFYDCGSSLLVKAIEVAGCDCTPCYIKRGSEVEITLELDSVPELDTLNVETAVYFFGNKFVMESHLENPCIIGYCPLREVISGARFNITVSFPSNLISRPGDLVINATYVVNGSEALGLCVGFDIDITK